MTTETTRTETTADAIEINCVESDTELHHHYRGQTSAQDCYVWLNCKTSKIGASHNAEIGNAVPFAVHHGHTQRWSIPVLKAAPANALLDEIAPLAARVVAGYSSEWDGSNHVAEFDEDAEEARDEIKILCERATSDAEHCDGSAVAEWEADDWYSSLGDSDRQRRDLEIGANTTDDELDAIETREEEAAKANGCDVLNGLDRFLRRLRDEALDEAPTSATTESGSQRFKADLDRTRDRARGEIEILSTETSDAIEDDDGVTQWPDAQPADHDAVRDALEAGLGVWMESLPSGGDWSAAEGEGECATVVSLSDVQPTHCIVWRPQGGAEHITTVRLVDGSAYTHAEWETESASDWTVNERGEWLFQGQATPGGAVGEVRIERI